MRAAEAARQRFHALGIDVISISGASAEAASELAQKALDSDVDALVVCGGDGLIGLALQHQAHHEMPLGIIPAGTGNDHARMYGIPLDPAAAAEVVARGNVKVTDLGKLTAGDDPDTSVIFGTIACQGFDSLANERTNKMKWPTGRSRYTVASLLELIKFRNIPSRITIAEEEAVRELDVMLVAVGNTSSYGGGATICPTADPTDGLFDVTIVHAMKKLEALAKLGAYFKGERHDDPHVSTVRTSRIRIEMDGEIPCYADGDRFSLMPIEAEILPNAGRYLVP